jgi:hypothetical protein
MSHRTILTTSLVAAGLAAAAIAPSADAAPTTATFTSTGAEQSFVVPAGVRELHVVAIGARGGAGARGMSIGTLGGSAAQTTADVPVLPGQKLFVEVGDRGADATGSDGGAGGFNGGAKGGSVLGVAANAGGSGGGGGGASDLRTVDRASAGTLGSRLLVAAGGGGGGGGNAGGLGGDASSVNGGDGLAGVGATGGAGGAGATPAAPGGKGAQIGALGLGGAPNDTAFKVDSGAGGGGGAGLFGGAGALNGSGGGVAGGGGGAGSSGTIGAAQNTTVVASSAEPSITLTFDDGTTSDSDLVLDDLAATPRTFKAANSGGTITTSTSKKTGTTLSWDVSGPSLTTFTVFQMKPGRKVGDDCLAPKKGKAVAKKDRCSRPVEFGSFNHQDEKGVNEVRFSGRFKGKRLAKGSYQLEATPSTPDFVGDSRTITFKIK